MQFLKLALLTVISLSSISYASECEVKKIIVQEANRINEPDTNCVNLLIKTDRSQYFRVTAKYEDDHSQDAEFDSQQDVFVTIPSKKGKKKLLNVELSVHSKKNYLGTMTSGEIRLKVKNKEDELSSGVLSYKSFQYYMSPGFHGMQFILVGTVVDSSHIAYQASISPGLASFDFSEIPKPKK